MRDVDDGERAAKAVKERVVEQDNPGGLGGAKQVHAGQPTVIQRVGGDSVLGLVNVVDYIFEEAATTEQHAHQEQEPGNGTGATEIQDKPLLWRVHFVRHWWIRADGHPRYSRLRYSATARSQPRRRARFQRSGVGMTSSRFGIEANADGR